MTHTKSEAPQFPGGITLVGSQMRSTNLERDVRSELHAPYAGARTVDVLDRLTNALGDAQRSRAWSFTGPYGSGKSTLANLIDALLGRDADRRAEAEAVLGQTSAGLLQRLTTYRDQLAPDGFLGAVATARREPLAATLARALHTAAEREWGKRTPKAIAAALANCADPSAATPKSILTAASALSSFKPVLLVVDEFGKTLEHLTDHQESSSARDDLFLLQEVAERSAGARGWPLFMMTLQHMSFLDHARRSSDLQTREWAKIQGRFEDIVFTPQLGDSVQLMRRRLDHTDVTDAGRKLIEAQAQAAETAWGEHGLNVVVDLKAQDFADLYPLHPLTSVAAPFLASQIGQHDRSLSGFLNNDEPNTVRRSLAEHSSAKPKSASTIRLPQLYNFFLTSGRTSLLAASNASRWIEIESRISEANGLSDTEQDLLRTVGMLNLIDSDGVLRATAAMIHFALHEPSSDADAAAFTALKEQLDDLVTRGFLVYRQFSGEYRVWRGTDVDIQARVQEIIEHLDEHTVIQRLTEHVPQAVAAGRHSQITGMLRVMSTRVTGSDTQRITGPDALTDRANGLVVFHLGTLADRPLVDATVPVILGTTEDPSRVLHAATYLVALDQLGHDKTLDPVARREVIERITEAKAELLELLSDAFYPPTPAVTWRMWTCGITAEDGGGEIIEGRSLSALASIACDRVFPGTPRIRNEMLGRHELTSQGAKSRRELLTAMLLMSGEQYLGIKDYPAERAMYSGALAYMGLHRENTSAAADVASGSLLPYGFSRPDPVDYPHTQPVWNALDNALTEATKRTGLDEIWRTVMLPPYGVKSGVVPLLVVTALILRSQDVALFEEGSYLPRLTPDIVERMVKAPKRFAVKYTPLGDGLRRNVVKNLSIALNVDQPRSQALRNPALLAVTRALLERVMVLTPYARRTRRLGPDAIAVRSALAVSQDPDDLLFHALPEALGMDPIGPDTKVSTKGNKGFTERLAAAADEISAAGSILRAEAVETISREFRLPPLLPELRKALAARLRGFKDVSLSLELRGFVAIALNEQLPDDDWLDPLVVRLSHAALGDWTDNDARLFPQRVREMAAALDRVSHLYKQRQQPSGEDENLDAQLLTLTDQEGSERRTLIFVPAQARQEAEILAVSVVEHAEKKLGPDGARILLAALAERLAEPTTSTAAERTE
ncbi:ATP-binding protein [Actinacidiphila glaucinigra]|uniref:ATP-binding protein n=1 Tax=Actinacidiphila glaucinigra TaxID=235986 RepID=UPI003800D5D9